MSSAQNSLRKAAEVSNIWLKIIVNMVYWGWGLGLVAAMHGQHQGKQPTHTPEG